MIASGYDLTGAISGSSSTVAVAVAIAAAGAGAVLTASSCVVCVDDGVVAFDR